MMRIFRLIHYEFNSPIYSAYYKIKLPMASLLKRKEQVNELRKAHFPFGFESNKGVVSEYRKEYTEQPVSIAQPNGDKNSHFTIASDEPAMAKNNYQSEFKEKYPQHPYAKQQSLRKSNDENHVVFGFGNNPQATNYKDEFVQKHQERSKPVDQRIISVDLGDTLTDFTTSYNKAYDGTQGEKAEKAGNSVSNTHLVLGYDQNNFVTSNAAIHNIKPISSNNGKGRSYVTNINLGNDQPHFHSQNKAQYSHKSTAKPTVQKQKVLDFKSAHFKLGFPEQQTENISQAKHHYNEKPLNPVKIEGKRPVNVQLKHDSNTYFQSSYGDHFQEKKGEKAQLLNKNGRNNNVVIGLGTEVYNSEAKDQFGPKNIERVRGKGTQGSLVIGDGTREFTTQYQEAHGNKFGEHEPNRVGKEQILKMRGQHYVNGFNNLDYKLHSQNYGAIGGGEGNRLPREVIDKMRSTNIVNSDVNAFYGSTTHKSAFGWKKNDDF